MNKEVLLALIEKDINELAILNKGFSENEIVSATILGLAKTKAENILTGLAQLGELQAPPKAAIEPVVATKPEPEFHPVFVEPQVVKEPEPEVMVELEPEPEIETAVEPEIPVVPEPELPTPDPIVPAPEPEAEPVVEVKPEIIPIAEPKPEEETAKTSLAEVLNANGHSLNEQLQEKAEPSLANILSNSKIEDLRQALSLAERFRFQRELFSGNGEKMNTTLSALNAMQSEIEALTYLSAFNWKEDDGCAMEFKQLVHRKFM